MTQRIIEQINLETPSYIVPCTITSIAPSCSRYWPRQVTPLNLRLGHPENPQEDVIVRAWLTKGYPWCDSVLEALKHQLNPFKIYPQFGVSYSPFPILEIYTPQWFTSISPWDLLKEATEFTSLSVIPFGSPDW